MVGLIAISVETCVATHQPPAPPTDGRPITSRFVQNLPFIQVTRPDGEPLWMLLDTGCTKAALASKYAPSTKVVDSQFRLWSMTDGLGNDSAAVPVRVGGQSIVLRDVLYSDLTPFSETLGFDLDGIIGDDVFLNNTVTIDYENEAIRIVQASEYTYEVADGTIIPLTTTQSCVTAALIGGPADWYGSEVFIDTGLLGACAASDNAITRMPAPERVFEMSNETVEVRGFRGVVNGTRGYLVGLRFGAFGFEHLPLIRVKGIFDKHAVILGSHVMSTFVAIYDLSRSRIVLRPSRRGPQRPPTELFGFGIVWRAPEYKRAFVAGEPREEAEACGLRAGMEIARIENKGIMGIGTGAVDRLVDDREDPDRLRITVREAGGGGGGQETELVLQRIEASPTKKEAP